jgi:hypothetical protein
MPFELVGRGSRPGGTVNEDALGMARFGAVEAAWVLDGATGLADREQVPDGPTDAAWLAGALSEALAALDPGERPPRDYFGQVLEQVAARYRALVPGHAMLPPYALPSAAGVWLRLTDDRLDIAHQGDCVAVVERQGGVQVFGVVDQTGLDSIGELIEARRSKPGKLLHLLGDELRARRARLNQPGGYWMLGVDPRAAAALSAETLAVSPGARILLCSDGYWRLVDHFGRYDAAGLLHASFAQGAEALLDELRALEAADPDGRAAPRVKPMDDATVLLLGCRAASDAGRLA